MPGNEPLGNLYTRFNPISYFYATGPQTTRPLYPYLCLYPPLPSNLGAQFLEAGPRVEDPMVTSVQPVQGKNNQESGTAVTLGSHPTVLMSLLECPTWSSKSPPGLDISCLLLCQGPYTLSLPIELPTSAQLPNRLKHLSLCLLETLCSLVA